MASRYAIPVPSRFCLPGFAGVMGRPFACMFLTLLAGRHSESTPGNYCCFFPLLWVFLWMYRLISVVTFSWTENGQEWTWCCSRMDIRVCVCLVSACSSSWYVLYLFVRLSFGLLSTSVLLRAGSLTSAYVRIQSSINHNLTSTYTQLSMEATNQSRAKLHLLLGKRKNRAGKEKLWASAGKKPKFRHVYKFSAYFIKFLTKYSIFRSKL